MGFRPTRGKRALTNSRGNPTTCYYSGATQRTQGGRQIRRRLVTCALATREALPPCFTASACRLCGSRIGEKFGNRLLTPPPEFSRISLHLSHAAVFLSRLLLRGA